MSLLVLVILVLAAGVIVYFIHRAPWIAPTFKSIASAIILVVVGLIVLDAFGVIDAIRGVQVPRVGK